MWKLLKRKKQVVAKAERWYEARLRRWASSLSAKAVGWPKKKLLALLAAFCMVFTVCSTYAIIQGFTVKRHVSPVTRLTVLHHVGADSTETKLEGLVQQRIQAFRGYLQRLQQTTQGKKIYDSLVKARPGLMDSLHILEQLK